MRDLPRQLTRGEVTDLFESDVVAVGLTHLENPLENARDFIATLSEEEQIAALNAHPRIGDSHRVSARSAGEQGSESPPEVLEELARLNGLYEERFGFRFIVFVDGRSRSQILPILRERLERARDDELQSGLDALVAIAIDRWRRG